MGNSGKPLFYELEQESKIRLIKSHSKSTPAPLTDRLCSREKREGLQLRETLRHHDMGNQAKNLSRTTGMAGEELRKRHKYPMEVDTTYSPARKGEKRLAQNVEQRQHNKITNSLVPCYEWTGYPGRPPGSGLRRASAGRNLNEHGELTVLCPKQQPEDPVDHDPKLSGGGQQQDYFVFS